MAFSVKKMSITPAVIVKAETLLRDRRHSSGEEWREPRTGFTIRFYQETASFLLRHEKATPTLGTVGELQGHVARHLADQCRQAIRDRRDHGAYLKTYLERLKAGASANDAHVDATKASAANGGVISNPQDIWLWPELVERYVEYKTKHDLKKGRWAKQFKRFFDDPAFEPFKNRRASDLTHIDYFRLKRALVPSGEKPSSRASDVIGATIGMLNWALANEPEQAGLLDRDPIWRAIAVSYSSKPRRRAPKPLEIARLILAVERHAALGDGVVTASRTVQTFLLFVAFTCQRTGAAMQLKRDDVRPHKSREGWRIAHFGADVMKGQEDEALAHAVPIPPVVAQALDRLWDDVDPDRKSDWAFPARRGDGHVAANCLNALFRQLNGRAGDERPATKADYEGKPGPKPRERRVGPDLDLFEIYLRPIKDQKTDKTYFTPHDLRRSITNFLKNRRLGRGASAVLAHRMDDVDIGEHDEETKAERLAATTSRYYDTAQQIALKTEALALWSEALEGALKSERDEVERIGRALA
jgi:integrase